LAPEMTGASFTAVAVTLLLVLTVVKPFWVTAKVKPVATVPPGATWCAVGEKVNPSSSAVRLPGVAAASVYRPVPIFVRPLPDKVPSASVTNPLVPVSVI